MKTEDIENKIKNLTYITVIGFVVLFMLVIGLYFKGDSKVESTSNTNTPQSSDTYDISRLNVLDKDKAEEMLNKKGIQFLYVGRSGCGVCQALLPNLNEVIDDLDLDINYLSLDIDTWDTDFKEVFKHLSIETTINSANGKTYEGTYGELLEENGFTPYIVVLKDGEMIDGFVGSRDVATLKQFFQKYI